MAQRRLVRGLLFRSAAVALGLLLPLALLEVALRLGGYDPLARMTAGRSLFLRLSDHPDVPYELTPGARGWIWGTQVQINSHGFRDREYTVEKPAGVRRIVALGDSITFGNRLPARATYPERLEARFAEAGLRVEVLNLGVGGFDTLDEVAFFEALGARFAPDVVVLGYCINDIGVNSFNLGIISVLNDYGWLIRNLRVAQLVVFRMQQTRLMSPSQGQLDRAAEERRRAGGQIASVAGDEELRGLVRRVEGAVRRSRIADPYLSWYRDEARLGQLRHAFERLRELAARDGFEVVVVVVPLLVDRELEEVGSAYAVVAHEARRMGFRVIDMQGPFATYGPGRLLIRDGGPVDAIHPNAVGHEMIAERLFEALEGPDP